MSKNFPMGITGPRGGMVSAEMGSPHYGFVVELKKSPKAVGPMQAEAHLVSVGNSVNFPDRGVYARIYGEKYKGKGVFRQRHGRRTGQEKEIPTQGRPADPHPLIERRPRGAGLAFDPHADQQVGTAPARLTAPFTDRG